MTVPARRPGDWLVILLVTAMGIGMAFKLALVAPPWSISCYATNNCDALTFAVAGQLVREGQSPYSSDMRAARLGLDAHNSPFVLPFQYPPHSLPVFALMSVLFQGPAGFLFWIGGTTLAFLATTAALARRETRPHDTLLYATIAGSGLVVFNAFLGQTGALIAALVNGALLLWMSHPATAGILLGLLTIKPHYALPIAIVVAVRRDTRVAAGMASCAGAMAIVSGVLYGFSYWIDYPQVLGAGNFTVPFMVSWIGLAQRVWPTAQFSPRTTIALFMTGLIAMTVLVFWLERRRVSLLTQIALVLACTLVLSPNTHPYDLLLLVPVLTVLAKHRVGMPMAFVFLVLSWVALAPPGRWALVLGVFVTAGLCIWAAILEGLRSQTRGRSGG